MSELIDVIINLTLWGFILIVYFVFGSIFGSILARTGGHNTDDLRWIILGIVIFVFMLFPLTYYAYYNF